MKLAAFIVVALFAAGCRQGPPEGRRPVDDKLLLALEEARAWQHRADTHLADGDLAAATTDVEQVLKITFPSGAPEGEEARLDAWARLAKLHLSDENRALEDVDHGRKEATTDSFYRAHLETVAGEIFEARAKRLADSDGDAAKGARRDALAAYARSIEINKRVQAALLQEGR